MTIPERLRPAYHRVECLARHNRYEGAFVFGSVARGEATDTSDLDVKVVVNDAQGCGRLSHPVIGGVKLDISFQSLDQLARSTEREIDQGRRVPMIAESLIVFDKASALVRLKERACCATPRPVPPTEYPEIQFIVYHVNDKVERNVESDPLTALLAMHTSLNDLLQIHYRLQRRWLVSSKRLLCDLARWDPALTAHVTAFVRESGPPAKFALWSAMIDHILTPLGGRLPIAENVCVCDRCRRDRETLLTPC